MIMKNIINKIFLFVLSISILLSASACKKDEPHPEEEIITFMLNSDPVTLDPQIASDHSSHMLIANLFEGLVRIGKDGNIISGIAESWDISEDGLNYVFHLYKDTCWSNGVPVTADDFVFGITRALTPETKAEDATDLFLIKNASAYYNGNVTSDMVGVKAIDKYTLDITLEYNSDSLLFVLTEPVAMPCCEDFFNSAKGKYGKSDELTITNGPFKIRDTYGWDHDSYIFIRRNEYYHAANTAVPLGVNFTFSQQSGDPINSILSGQADICEIFAPHLKSAEKNNLNVTTTTNTLWGICFNADSSAFSSKDLRLSLLSSIDRGRILRGTPRSYVKTSQLIDDNVLFAGMNYRSQAGEFTIDTFDSPESEYSKAVQELTENGSELKSSFTIIYLNDDVSSKIVNAIIEQWNNTTGSYLNKQPLSRNELEERLRNGNYEIAVAPINTAVESPMEFLSRFVTNSFDNYINLNNDEYNELIAAAYSENGYTSLSALMNAERLLIQDAYLYPLYYESRYFAAAENVTGAVFSKSGESIDFTKATKISEG